MHCILLDYVQNDSIYMFSIGVTPLKALEKEKQSIKPVLDTFVKWSYLIKTGISSEFKTFCFKNSMNLTVVYNLKYN